MKSNQKELLQIAFFCFIAESFFRILSTFFKIGILTITGFKTDRIISGFDGCVSNDWSKVVLYFGVILFYFILAFIALKFSKIGFQNGNKFLIIIGSVCLFPILQNAVRFIIINIKDPFYLLASKGHFQKVTVPLFGNLYNLRIATFIEFVVYIILAFSIGWITYSKYWDKPMKYKFFSVGSIASISGIYFWFFIVKKPFEALINSF